jgi:hypothetical protein
MKGTAVKLGLLAALWLIATNLGAVGTIDTDLRLRMAHAWWSGEPEVSPDLPPAHSREQIEYGIVGANGKRIIFYDPGQPLIMLPGDWLATMLAPHLKGVAPTDLRRAVVAWTLFLPLNIAAVLAAFWLLLRFGVEERLAGLSSLLWLAGTTVLPYAQVAFQNNQVLLCALVAHAAILEWARNDRKLTLLISGVATGFALLLRVSSAIHVLTIGLFLLVVVCATTRSNGQRAKALMYWMMGFFPLAIGERIFDYERYGGVLMTGQTSWARQINTDAVFAGLPQLPQNFPFTNSPLDGIWGVLFSPAKSIFLYDPLLLPCLVALVLAWQHLHRFVRWYVVLVGLNLVLHVGLSSRLNFWHGDWAWGARYHITSIDLLVLPLLPLLVQRAFSDGKAIAWLVRFCLAAAVGVQLLAVTMPYGAEIAADNIEAHPNCDEDTWDTDLSFRLKGRVTNLYCLAAPMRAPICEDPPVIKAARAKPLCAADLRTLEQHKRLAFFPFSRPYRTLAPRLSLAMWGAIALVALMLTITWCRSWLMDVLDSSGHCRTPMGWLSCGSEPRRP